MLTSSCGPTALYAAAGSQCEVFCTHAVAAALLAYGKADLDPLAIPE